MKDLESWIDSNLEPPRERIVGYDWKGNELYGYEFGFMIDGEFVCEDEVLEYIESQFNPVVSGDVMGGY